MKIETGKVYSTRNRNKVRIICDDKKGTYSVVGIISKGSKEKVVSFTATGYYNHNNKEHKLDLVEEHIFWDNIEIDTPIYVRNSKDSNWLPRYFAKYENGRIYVWDNGRTSFSLDTIQYSDWKYAKLAYSN